MGTRAILRGLVSDLGTVTAKSETAVRGLQELSAQAKNSQPTLDEVAESSDQLSRAQQSLKDSFGSLFANAEQLATFQPVVQQFLEGLVTANDVMQALGASAAGLLPSTSDVQQRIKEMVDQALAQTDQIAALTELLQQRTDRFAVAFLYNLKLFQQGKLTLEQLLKLGEQYSETLPDGSASQQLIDAFGNALLQDGP